MRGAHRILLIILGYLTWAVAFPPTVTLSSYWPLSLLGVIFCLSCLLRHYANESASLILVVFLATYYAAPLPFVYLDLPIVPYTENVSSSAFLATFNVMALFLTWFTFFALLTAPAPTPTAARDRLPKLNIRRWSIFYWIILAVFVAGTFRGEPIVNISGTDNYDAYTENLKSQSGALEYFLALMLIGFVIIKTKVDRLAWWALGLYYLYFCFTRGYRVQLLEMVVLITILQFDQRLNLRKILTGSVALFFLLQAHGFMKHGADSFQSLFTVLSGDEVRSNQTEVFYTTNNVVIPLLEDQISIGYRLESFATALAAVVIPAGALPDVWHSTLASQAVTRLPGGGGGFIAGHFFFWLSYIGPLVAGAIIAGLLRAAHHSRNNLVVLACTLPLCTFPRWIAYEPVGMLFRASLLALAVYLILNFIVRQIDRASLAAQTT